MICLEKSQRSKVRIDICAEKVYWKQKRNESSTTDNSWKLCLYIDPSYRLIDECTEQQRENDRELRKAGREIERERKKLDVEEKKIVSNIFSISALNW